MVGFYYYNLIISQIALFRTSPIELGLEYWNGGILGLGEMGAAKEGIFIIPLFQHSIIPDGRHGERLRKYL